MSETEIKSREEIFFENYAKIVNIEALTMIEMAMRDIIPAVNAYIAEVSDAASAKLSFMPEIDCCVERDIVSKLSALNANAYHAVEELKKAERDAASTTDAVKRAEAYCDYVIPAMQKLRGFVDEMEPLTASEYWPLPTYGDMMFRV